MITIIFEAHGTTYDNEAHRASGHYDVELSELGQEQAKQLGERYKDRCFDAVFCSELQRSYRTAEIAFASRNDIQVIRDPRLRECDYGDWTKRPSEETEAEKLNRISQSFPNGESYEDTAKRMKSFLDDLKGKYDEKTILIIGHRATQYGLEHWINHVPLLQAVTAPWQWQPGWEYRY
jgi:alpha-ribazole phosphatase/probable phosphoglycerate mutase